MNIIKCIYVSASTYEKLCKIGLVELAYKKPLKKYNAWFSKSANCWIDPKVFFKSM